jgi:hypothetical protein
MKRRLICKQILTAAVLLPALTAMLVVPAHSQVASGTNPPGVGPAVMNPHDLNTTISDAPPGMGEGEGPFSGHHGPQTFGGKAAPEDKPAVSTFPGEVHGVTRYPSGLPMPGAEVAILGADVNVDRTIVSGSDGTFVFKNLKPGEYQLTARKEGFDRSPITKVELAAGKIVTTDVPLGPSLAASPLNRNSVGRPPAYSKPAYNLQPASLRVAASQPESNTPAPAATTPAPAASTPATEAKPSTAASPLPAEVVDELDAMRRRIDELEAALKAKGTPDQPGAESAAPAPAPAVAAPVTSAVTPAVVPGSQDAQAAPAPKPGPGQFLATGGTITTFRGDTDIPDHPAGFDPFSYADWTWMNANGRQHDSPWSTKYFTPEFRADVNYMDDFNHPVDDTMGGSTESFRVNEWQLEQLSLGGDIRIGHVRGRILTMFGMFATTTPRNDGSAQKGQWDLGDAYRYISEGWGGYHFDVNHGLNIDAGIFVSYIGLFSYYNFDNWTYQPSYVSSNTPWFFNGLRIQWFPTGKLKIEPWIINGWQSYNRYNSKPGLGGQILWRPRPWLSFVFNNYGMGTDVLGNPGASRIHTDDSMEVREYNNPDKFMDMAAMSFTADAGCQYGGLLDCWGDKDQSAGGGKSSFLGWMAYQRFQFKHDTYGLTLGGGYLNNPGRYLTLLQPINGANAVSGSPYFEELPGNPYHAYDATATFDYMPSQWLTFRWEMGYRHSDVPYWSGHNGITPPGGAQNVWTNNGSPSSYVCTNGVASIVSAFSPTSAGFYHSSSNTNTGDNGSPSHTNGAVDQSCAAQAVSSGLGTGWYAWAPDLRHSQVVATFAIMTRF